MIEETTTRSDYTGNGSTATYDYSFKIVDETHLTVVVRDTDDAEHSLSIGTDYTVTGVASDSGGTIVLVDGDQAWIDSSGFLADDMILSITRNIPYTQTTDVRNQADYYPEIHETAFDKLVMMIQQLKDEMSRSFKSQVSDFTDDLVLPTAAQRAGLFLAFDDDGNPTVSSASINPDDITVSAFMETLLDDLTAQAARQTLGFSGTSGTVAAANIDTDAVTTAKILALAVTTAKIAANAVTTAKLANDLISGMTTVDPALDDYVSISDTSDSGNIKKSLISKLKNSAVRSVTTTDGATAADETLVLSGASFTETLITAVGNTGKVVELIHAGTSLTQTYTVASAGGNVAGAATSALHTAGEVLRLRSDGTNWLKISRYVPAIRNSFTPTGAWSSNTTYTGYWWRTSNLLNFDVKVAVAGAPTSASLTINLPANAPAIDTTVMLDTTAGVTGLNGTVSIRDVSADNFTGMVRYNDSGSIAVFKDDGDGTNSTITQAAPMTFANGDFVIVRVRDLPMTGWHT